MKKLILASSSKYRKELLEKLGIPFECHSPDIDEDSYKEKLKHDPKLLAETLATLKAEKIAQDFPEAVVIGSDQLGHLDGEILGKTGSFEGSLNQLKKMQGKTHELITAVSVVKGKENFTFTNITTLTMRKMTEEQIKFYLSQDNPFDCAGSYKLELRGVSLFKKILTEDHTAIIGLPLMALGDVLANFGFCIPPEK